MCCTQEKNGVTCQRMMRTATIVQARLDVVFLLFLLFSPRGKETLKLLSKPVIAQKVRSHEDYS